MSLVQIHHLEQWGQTVAARDQLGRLLATLIRATLPLGSIRSLRFLHGVANQLPGWDGELECAASNDYISDGKSLWELGTGAGETGKIREDFAKRLKARLPEGWTHETTVYIGVTLAKLQNPTALAAELANDSPWKQVRVIDAVALCHWLDLASSVDAWAYEQITGTPADGLQSLSFAWQQWSSITKPAIQTALVTAAREPDVRRVQEALTAGLQIEADSPDEAMAFVYAAIEGLDERTRLELSSKAVVIDKLEAAARFPRQAQQLLILKGPATAHAIRLAGEGHHVIRVHGRSVRSGRQGLQLVRQSRPEFAKALTGMGLQPERADIEARACGTSASVWRIWNLFHEADAAGVLPEWAKPEHLEIVVPVVLLGGWSERNANDVHVVETVTGRGYTGLRDKLGELQRLGDPLMEFVGDTIVVAAPATAFALLADSIGREVLRRFREQTMAVFGKTDPLLDVEPDQRIYAQAEGDKTTHSEWLREGMAETLLRISVLGGPLERAGTLQGKTSQQFVDELIRDLPGLRNNYRLLASLRDQLPVFAEAAPIPFMEALEALLQGDRDGLVRIFAEGSDFGHPLHPAFLWALETVAWDPRWLSRAVLILAGLDELDPGGHLSNRPAASIVDILLPWLPGTSASVQQRVDTVDALLARYPVGGWKVLLELLPNKHRVASGTRRPDWKETGIPDGATAPASEVAQLFSAYVDRAIAGASSNVDRLATLVDSYDSFSQKHRQQLEAALHHTIQTTPIDRLQPIWDSLRDFIGHHRQFPEAAWSLDDDSLRRLESLAQAAEPRDPLVRHRWLFSDHMPALPVARGEDDYSNELENRRIAAMRELWDDGRGTDRVVEFLRGSQYPGLVARALAKLEFPMATLANLFTRTVNGSRADEIFAMVLSGEAYSLFGDGWTAAILAATKDSPESHKARAIALLGYPDSSQLFALVRTLGSKAEAEFWHRHDGIIRSKDTEAVADAVRQLVKHRRARDAIVAVAEDKPKLDPSEMLAILDATWTELNEGLKPRVSTSMSYWIERVFERLRADARADRHAIALAEYKYLPLLVSGLEKKDLTIHEVLASDPGFFVQILCDLYKPEGADRESDGRSPQERQARARHAWDLLRSWKKPPGVQEDGSIDKPALADWVNSVRERARTVDRARMADQQVGHALFHTPQDPVDQAWPHTSVRELIEALRSDDIETGIRLEQYNARGVTSRAPLEGGAQERSMAELWRGWSNTVGARWPRTQSLLLQITEMWEQEAAREDVDAEKNRLRFS